MLKSINMLLGNNKTIKELILKELQNGPAKATDLVNKLKSTKQAVYLGIRELTKEEVIVKHKKIVSLNSQWIVRLSEYADTAKNAYFEHDSKTLHFLSLKEGQKVSYKFKTLQFLDAYWDHVAYSIMKNLEKPVPYFTYNTHWWFIFMRNETESGIVDFCKKNKIPFLETVGHNTPIDRYAAKFMSGDYAQYNILKTPLHQKNNYYINAIGDYFIEIVVDQKCHDMIEKIYHSQNIYTPELEKELNKILFIKGKSKFTISKNKTKSHAFQKKMQKYFYIPK